MPKQLQTSLKKDACIHMLYIGLPPPRIIASRATKGDSNAMVQKAPTANASIISTKTKYI